MQVLIHRFEPNRPHISSVISISKSVEPGSSETKSTGCALTFWRAPPYLPQCLLPRVPLERRSVVPSGVPLCASAPPVRGYLRFTAEPRNPFFRKSSSFLQETRFSFVFIRLYSQCFARTAFTAILLPGILAQNPLFRLIHRLGRETRGDSRGSDR